MSVRQYTNAPATALAESCSSVATSIEVESVAGLPISYPYVLIIDRGTASEEAVEVTAAGGTVLTVTRGVDSTTAYAHTVGAVVAHGITARDIREANEHVNADNGVHGVTGDVVGTTDTQTLTGKTIDLASNTLTGTKSQFNTALSGADFLATDDTFYGAWTAYTPTITGGFSAGSGASLAGRYVQLGKIVIFRARWVLGTGFTIGNGFGISLPVNYINSVANSHVGAHLGSAGVNVWLATASLSATAALPSVIGTNGAGVAITSTVPFTWKATDTVDVAGIYEAV